jgi:hypothetical protein
MNNLLDSGSVFDIYDCPPGFFGEWVPVYTEQDKKDAYEYFRLWKKFLLLKLHHLKQKNEDHIIDNSNPATPFIKPTLGIKILLEKKDEHNGT